MNDQEDDRATQLAVIQDRLGVCFKRLHLLERALTHASVLSEHEPGIRHYESLEFLGDAALSLAIADLLFEQIPERSPGEYSRMRAALVNRRTLARLAKQLGLGEVVRLGRGEERAGGRVRDSLLEECFEALIGAIYLDQGWQGVQKTVRHLFANEIDHVRQLDKWLDYKSKLQHICQVTHRALPKFVVIHSAGPDHQKKFEVEVLLDGVPLGRGVGFSKKDAEQEAARVALEQLNQVHTKKL